MKLVTGLMPPTSGEIIYDGQRVQGPVRGAGMAFQNATLLPWRSTIDNVILPLEIVEPFKRNRRHGRKLLQDRAQKLLETVGLAAFADHFPWQLSGGMQQRTNLCRAIVHELALVMLEEPFAALDAFTKEDLWNVLQALWLCRRVTAVPVTHDLREAPFLSATVFISIPRPAPSVHLLKAGLPRPRPPPPTSSPSTTTTDTD